MSAYYASSLALRSVLDFDGFVVLAGGASWAGNDGLASKRAPIFVGVSAADKQTAAHSRAFAGLLAAKHWPYNPKSVTRVTWSTGRSWTTR